MNLYLWLKWLHILSAVVLFGTGIGIAYFKWTADRRGDVRTIRAINDQVVRADWAFTAPAAIAQPLTGLALALIAGLPLSSGWIVYGIALYGIAGIAWLIVLRLQWRMRELARRADSEGRPLPPAYRVLVRRWVALGFVGFAALIGAFWVMVFKPA